MVWVLTLHIATLLIWCAALLYMPVLVAGHRDRRQDSPELYRPFDSVERFVFTHVATPAALAAIITGTLVFLIDRTLDAWLMVKLTLVSGLVLCHALVGLLVLRAEAAARGEGDDSRLALWCRLLPWVSLALMMAIVWVVLAKPGWGL